MQSDHSTGCSSFFEVLSRHLPLEFFRGKIKEFLLSNELLCEESFYQETEISYIPRKSVLKKIIGFKNTFKQNSIAKFISMAHQRDESFDIIIQTCRSALNSQKFSCLIILASGSGQLASHLLSELEYTHIQNISEKIYGVDISHTMSAYGAKKLSTVSYIDYIPVATDCTSSECMKFWIPELSQNTPVLIVSHGGARYFAENGENRFLESVSAFPKESRVIVTEVGFELYKLMYNLACTADSIPNLDVFDFSDIESTSHHNCWNLSYYYFLTQHYTQSPLFRSFIDELIGYPQNGLDAECRNCYYCINFILLEIAGYRKQPVYLVDLYCAGNGVGRIKIEEDSKLGSTMYSRLN
jgi:hypothetical protein